MTPALPELQIGHMAKATEVEQYPIGGDRIPMLIHDDFGLVNIVQIVHIRLPCHGPAARS